MALHPKSLESLSVSVAAKPTHGQIPTYETHSGDCSGLAQACSPQPRIIVAGKPQPSTEASIQGTETWDNLSIGQIVLDNAFAGGAHLAYANGGFRRFSGTHWLTLSDAELGGVILQHLPTGAGRGRQGARATIREVTDLLKMHQATGPDRSHLNEPLPVINVANGELWIMPNGPVELRPHDPASGLRYCLDVVYDPKATCPLYDRTLSEIFSASTAPAALVAFWHEFTGYVLQPARPNARIFVGWGKGNDGKTALAGLLVRLLGRERVAGMPVGELASNRFMLSHLAGKVLFLDDDVAVGTILPDGMLKTISEAKIVTGEPKHRDAFEFRVGAPPLLLCNVVPYLRDTSHGFRRRLTVIPFERQFTSVEADLTLFPRIWEERSGVLNRALEGLQRVIGRAWKFDLPVAVNRASEAWWAEATGVTSALGQAARPGSSITAKGHKPTSNMRQPLTASRTKGRMGARAAEKSGTTIQINVSTQRGDCAVKVRADTAAQVAVHVGITQPTKPRTI